MGLRILHITTIDLTAFCFLRTTCRLLRDSGHEVALATTVQSFRKELEPCLDHLFPVNIERKIRPLQDLRSLGQLVQVIRSYRPDIVHTHTSKAGLIGRLAATLCRVPLVIHTIYELPQNSTRNPWIQRLYWFLENLAARWCHHMTTISWVNADQIVSERIARPEQLTLIRVGIELENYRPQTPSSEVRAKWGLPENARVLGIAARLEPAKGHADLLKAFSLLADHHADLHLVILGKGQLRDQLEQQIVELGLHGRVHIQGWVDDLVSAMAALDVFVLSSHYEGLGVVLLEALALERPVVSTRVGGTQDIVTEGVTGVSCPPHDPDALAQAIERVLQNPEAALRMARAGRKWVEQEFQANAADRQTEELYRDLWDRLRTGSSADRVR